MNENNIIRTVPAASALHKVPGFDPLKYLRKTFNAAGDPVMRLDLPYKRLWFRMAYPNGRMLLNPLRVTDQMAIFEAQVFFSREDPTPASSFTSDKKAREVRNYIRAAQDEALNMALDNAGFGIQLCDVAQASGDGQYGSDIPLTQDADKQQAQTAKTAAPAQPAEKPQVQVSAQAAAMANQTAQQTETATHTQATDGQPIQQVETVASVQSTASQPAQQVVTAETAPLAVEHSAAETAAPAPVETEQVIGQAARPKQEPSEASAPVQTEQQMGLFGEKTEQTSQSDVINNVVTMLNFPTSHADNAPEKIPVSDGKATESVEPEVPVQTSPTYTDDMPMEEILQSMTLDEARAFQIKTGICKGWTLAQVADKRPSSLKFYTNSCCNGGNVLKAAATLVLQAQNQQKAG